MIPKKFRIRLGQFFGQTNWLSFKREEVLFQRWLGKEFAESIAQNNLEAPVEGDQPRVKCGIVKRREAKSVARIQSFGGEFAPRFDMARHQQARDIDAADTAPDIVGIEHSLPEKLLPTPHLDIRPVSYTHLTLPTKRIV